MFLEVFEQFTIGNNIYLLLTVLYMSIGRHFNILTTIALGLDPIKVDQVKYGSSSTPPPSPMEFKHKLLSAYYYFNLSITKVKLCCTTCTIKIIMVYRSYIIHRYTVKKFFFFYDGINV